MTLETIRIVNIKGIADKTFPLKIIPNKPSLLYAPNGFGKSSLTIAFNSFNRNRIRLQADDYHENNEANRPRLELSVRRADHSQVTLICDDTSNTISPEFDVFVINNQLRAKGTRLRFGGRTNFSASLAVESIALIDSIPQEENFPYVVGQSRQHSGLMEKYCQT